MTELWTGSEKKIVEKLTQLQQEEENILVLDSEEATIKIKQVREVLHETQHTSLTGKRIVLILGAEKLSTTAANALLKALEEPPSFTKFILTTQWPNRLLTTIRSRCQQVRLGSSPEETQEVTPLPSLSQKDALSEEALQNIYAALEKKLHAQGVNAELKRAYMRLRDYYFIKAHRGNTKLAQDVLLASLPQK